jgi:shikimate dehydrogenase
VLKINEAYPSSTKLLGIVGWPVAHSLSPRMHNAAFTASGLNCLYVPLPVEPSRLGEAIAGLRALSFRGCNVTIPHKVEVISYLDSISPAASAVGAVNTIVVENNGYLRGDNTDALGFLNDLKANSVSVSGSHAVVIGTGGSARAICYALLFAGIHRLMLVGRNEQAGMILLENLHMHFPGADLLFAPLNKSSLLDAKSAELIVNCTPVGMNGSAREMPWHHDVPFHKHQTVYDLVYRPMETGLLRKARNEGARTLGGLGMLVHQAALAFELWTGKTAPLNVMRQACLTEFAS